MASKDTISENVNFAKLCFLVVDICRDVLWDILINHIPPCDLQREILSNLKIIKLHQEQLYRINSVPHGSLLTKNCFDVSGLYRILRTICSNLPCPTRGWGSTPLAVDVTVADDIERINAFRNRIFGHATTSNIKDCDFNIYWKDIRRVIGRIDGEFDTEHLQKMRELKSRFLDGSTINSLKEELQCVMGYDKETREIVNGLEERLAAVEKSLNVSGGSQNDELSDVGTDVTNFDSNMPQNNSLKKAQDAEEWPDLPKDVRLVIVGKTGAGKSSFCNTILGAYSFTEYYVNASRTIEADISTRQRFGKKLKVCDTPGLFDTRFDNNHTRQEVSRCLLLTHPGPHAFIIVLRCDVRFSLEECQVITLLEEHFGKTFYKYSMVVFTHKDHLDRHKVTEESLLHLMPDKVKELLNRVNMRYVFVDNLKPFEQNEHIVKQVLHKINGIYKLNAECVYQNDGLSSSVFKSESTTESLAQKDEDKKNQNKNARWWHFWKWFW